MKWNAVFAIIFVALAVMELVMGAQTNDLSAMTYHRVGMFGFLILANLSTHSSKT